MRLALLLPVLFCVAAPAHAEGARESRYGPTPPRQASVAAATPYDGPMLNWANKRQASSDPVAAASPTPAQPAPLAPWAGYSTRPEPAAYTPPAARTPTPPTFAPPVAPRPTTLPTSLYGAPRSSAAAVATPAPARPAPRRDRAGYDGPPAPAAAVQPATPRPAPIAATPGPAKDWSGYRSVRMTTAAPASAPAPAPAPAAPAPPPPRQMAAASTGVTGARFYSVARESGLTPDPIPPAGPDHQVLITTDAATAPAEDAAPQHGSADWLAAGARGDDDGDDSATRRAKTRNQGL